LIRIFRINDPYRLILVFLIIIAFKIPFNLNESLYTLSELKNHIIGEKLNQETTLYKDLWDNISPLSAWFYMVLDSLFGKSKFAYQFFAILLFFIQAGMFNIILIRKKAYNENTYVPALFYCIFGITFFDLISFSPEMIGLTFIILTFDSLFNHLELRRKNDINLINIGIYVGIASLFYLPYIVYLLSITIGLLLFTNTIRRRYFLMYYGAFFGFLLLWMYFFLKDDSQYLIQNLIHPLVYFDYPTYFSFKNLAFIFCIPAIYLIFSIFSTFQSHGYTNYQVKIQSLFFLFMLFQIGSWLLWSQKSASSMIVFAPTFAFFTTHYFLHMKRKLWREVAFYTLLTAIILVSYLPFHEMGFLNKNIQYEKLLVKNIENWSVENEKILVIGNELSYYDNNMLATPFLNWTNCKSLFLDINDYENILTIYSNIKSDYPEYIVDEARVFNELMDHIPELKRNYRMVQADVYQNINN